MSIVAVVGLGYVGLPLAVEFGKVFETIGYDMSASKIEHFRRHEDPTGEVTADDFASARRLQVTDDPGELARADFLVVAVPTPVDVGHKPDFSPLVSASRTCGRHMKRGAIVVYESTVYPGATEEICIPVLEESSGMKWREDFHVGYSPERINPGDREHTLARIVKVVSGDDAETLERVAELYGTVVQAGVHRASGRGRAPRLRRGRRAGSPNRDRGRRGAGSTSSARPPAVRRCPHRCRRSSRRPVRRPRRGTRAPRPARRPIPVAAGSAPRHRRAARSPGIRRSSRRPARSGPGRRGRGPGAAAGGRRRGSGSSALAPSIGEPAAGRHGDRAGGCDAGGDSRPARPPAG